MNKMQALKYSTPLALLSFIIFCFACNSPKHLTSQNSESIARIENNLFAITRSGADTGIAYSVLERMNHFGVQGMSVTVFDQGKIIWTKGYGFRNKELKLEVDPTTVFQAASISKPVTSVATFKLVNKGLFNLDENINTYLRKWKVPENEFTSESKVTLRGIISHTAGLSVHGFYGYGPNDSIPTVVEILDGKIGRAHV